MRMALAIVLLTAAVAAAAPMTLDFSPSPIDAAVKKTRHQATLERTDRAPVIDGEIETTVWTDGNRNARIMPRSPQTWIHSTYDDDALYILLKCQRVDGAPITATAHDAHDSAIWRDDCIEIWINPTCGQLHHFIVNAAGARFDQVGGEPSVNPDWQAATRQTDQWWFAEIAIPRASLGMDRWHKRLPINVGRNGPTVGAKSWGGAWSSTTDSVMIFDGIDFMPADDDAAAEATLPPAHAATQGDSLHLAVDRADLRPGDRYLDASLALKPEAPLDACRVRARLHRFAEVEPIAEIEAAPARDAARLSIDLRRFEGERFQLIVELLENGKRTGAATQVVSIATAAPMPDDHRVSIAVDIPGDADVTQHPVTFGVPMPAGRLWDASRLGLVDDAGNPIAHQAEVTGLWARGGSVKWVRFDALITSGAGCNVTFDGRNATPPQPVNVSQKDETLWLDTGAARYVLGRGPSPIRAIEMNDRIVATTDGARGLYVIDQNGRLGAADDNDMIVEIEAAGPVTACVRMEGYYRDADGKPMARHITRVEAFAGKPFAKVTHTLVLTEDTNEVWFRDIGWELTVRGAAQSTAVFAAARDSAERKQITLNAGEAYMLQDRHYRFRHGDNHGLIATGGAVVHETEEIGDWAALQRGAAGLLVACREAARQHPKEFHVRPDRINLKLFSDRAGEQLDFRSQTLGEKWNIANWNSLGKSQEPDAKTAKYIEQLASVPSNAAGWAKTHELMFAPLAADSLDAAARDADLQSKRVFAHVDPWWIYETEAMERIHPKDTDRFPRAEQYIQGVVDYWKSRIPAWGDYGFVDYYAGPHMSYQGDFAQHKRYKYTYQTRPAVWTAYARSAQRDIRDFAQQTNMTHLDNVLAHWNTSSKTRGLFVSDSTSDSPSRPTHGTLPYHWENYSYPQISTSTNLRQWLYLYHLTGYRRAHDALLQYGEGLKQFWTPAFGYSDARPFKTLSSAALIYSLTYDPHLRAIGDTIAKRIWDPAAALWMTRKGRPYNDSTYKFHADQHGLYDGWHFMNLDLCRRMLDRTATWSFNKSVGAWPVTYSNKQPTIAQWLYQHNTDKSRIGEAMWYAVASAASGYQPDAGEVVHTSTGGFGHDAHETVFPFEGIAKAMDLAVRSGAIEQPTASWVAYSDMGNDTQIIIRREDFDNADILFRAPGGADYGPVSDTHRHGMALNRMDKWSGASTTHINIPSEAPAGDYWLKAAGHGEITAFAQKRIPMVLHAAGYWQPVDLGLPAPIFFKVDKDVPGAQIFFEGSAKLITPSGKPFAGGQPQTGWIDLTQPGVWAFEPVDNRMVRLRNAPPFFAFRDKAFYFQPDIDWDRDDGLRFAAPSPGEVYVDGALELPDDQALHIAGNRSLRFDDAERIPFESGTVEFFFKPNWSSLALPDGRYSWLNLRGPDGGFSFYYDMRREAKPYLFAGSVAELSQYVLRGSTQSTGEAGDVSLQFWRTQTFFDAGKWYHIAYTWGTRHDVRVQRKYQGKGMLVFECYVDGKRGGGVRYRWPGNRVTQKPTLLDIGEELNGAIDELRISDTIRYRENFTPPARTQPLANDEHTRALFHFNGNTNNVTGGSAELR